MTKDSQQNRMYVAAISSNILEIIFGQMRWMRFFDSVDRGCANSPHQSCVKFGDNIKCDVWHATLSGVLELVLSRQGRTCSRDGTLQSGRSMLHERPQWSGKALTVRKLSHFCLQTECQGRSPGGSWTHFLGEPVISGDTGSQSHQLEVWHHYYTKQLAIFEKLSPQVGLGIIVQFSSGWSQSINEFAYLTYDNGCRDFSVGLGLDINQMNRTLSNAVTTSRKKKNCSRDVTGVSCQACTYSQ
ncbi:hypothetical protein J6590_093973 [Homalodisca vitripennis]|nr:hypothetical protein J6590_093973 [Homalodisca vitripennis]